MARPELVDLMADALARMGTEHSLVVHGLEGLDEISIAGPSRVVDVRDGVATVDEVAPEDFGLSRAALSEVAGGTAAENAEMVRSVLAGDPGPRTDIVLLNAAAGMVVAGLADDIGTGIQTAREAIASGRAAAGLDRLVAVSNGA